MPARTTSRNFATWWKRRARRESWRSRVARSQRRELRGLDDLALLMLHVAGVRALLAVGDPVGIGFERVAAPLAVPLALEAPQEHDLIDGPDIRGEDPDRLTEMAGVDRQTLRLVQFEPGAEAPGHHRVGPEIDDHRRLPPS